MPEDYELLALVSTHKSDMDTTSSSGFDTITPTFIKRAFKQVPKQRGRGCVSFGTYVKIGTIQTTW